MKGNNTLQLNEATMIEAVQYWLDSQMMPGASPKVVRVAPHTDNCVPVFDVRLEEREPK